MDLVRSFDDKVDLDVVMLQQKLQLVVGEDCVKVDGVYGPRTTKAVALFLQQQGLAKRSSLATEPSSPGTGASSAPGDSTAHSSSTPEGGGTTQARVPEQMTPKAQALLQEAFLSELEARALSAAQRASQVAHTPLKPVVDYDENVKLLQISLNQVMGHKVVNPDGVWGPKTRRAVDEFQSLYGFPLGGDVAEQLKIISMVLRAAAAAEAGGEEAARPAEGELRENRMVTRRK